jgi:hypothetical protein
VSDRGQRFVDAGPMLASIETGSSGHFLTGGFVMEKGADCRFLDFKRRVTLRQVEILASLQETGSITETARLLKTSPASISRICLRFEAHFNFPVFDKKRKGLVLTEKGSLLIKCISRISEGINPHYGEMSEFFR